MIVNARLKFILLILLGVFILFFFVFIYFYQEFIPEPESQPNIQITPLSKSKKLTPEEEIELQKKAAEIIKTNDFNRCQEIENQIYRTVCINNIALNLAEEKQDISYCQKLDDKLISIASCERQVLLKKSQDKEDINICNETENSKIQKECEGSFWPSLAIKKKEINLCDNISTEQEKNSCYDNYLFQQEFMKSESNFDCQKFYSQQVKLDCPIYKENILNKKPIACDALKSDLFFNYCSFISRH